MKEIKNQVISLFGSTFSFIENDQERLMFDKMEVTQSGTISNIEWLNNQQNKPSVYKSNITISDHLFDELKNNSFPIDIRAMQYLKQSPMSLDIYCWLTLRMITVYKETAIRLSDLANQFGANYTNNSQRARTNFQQNFCRCLKEVLKVYPKAQAKLVDGRLILYPSPTHVPPKRRA